MYSPTKTNYSSEEVPTYTPTMLSPAKSTPYSPTSAAMSSSSPPRKRVRFCQEEVLSREVLTESNAIEINYQSPRKRPFRYGICTDPILHA